MNNLNVVLLLFAILNSDILKGKEYLKRNNNMYWNTEHRHDYDVIKLPLHHGSKYVASLMYATCYILNATSGGPLLPSYCQRLVY